MNEWPRFVPVKTLADKDCKLIIGDPAYWVTNEDAMLQWAADHPPGFSREGLVLTFPTEYAKIEFVLAWG